MGSSKAKAASSGSGGGSGGSVTATDDGESNKKGLNNVAILIAILAVVYAVLQSKSSSTSQNNTTDGTSSTTEDSLYQALGSYHDYFGNLLSGNSDANSTTFAEEWDKLQASIGLASSTTSLKAATSIGHRMALEKGSKALHPVFIVPGFVTSGLELWEGQECAIRYFRRKIWGSMETFHSFARDTECWKQHLSLDPITGKDPPGIRLRPSQGFEAADFWTSGFWVWDRVIRNLAAVGYDGSTMDMVSYDWRLSYPALEERDGHFSKLKKKIEAYVDFTGQKAVLVGHSMGGPKVFFFLVWVCKPKEEGGGGGGADWVERYIHAYVDLAGPMLGLPKAASALLSGEMKDTNLLSSVGGLIESLFGRKRRHELVSSWGALWGMAPKGGDAIWGVTGDVDCGKGMVLRGDECVDEKDAGEPKNTPFLTFTDPEPPTYENPTHAKYAAKSTWSFSDVMGYLSEWKQGHHGPESLKGIGSWNDPTQHGLPNAPSLNVYCLYGVGLPTERMFYYRRQEFVESDVPFVMNDTIEDNPSESINFGVRTANGDGSVPLISLGYMCADGWKEATGSNPLNPGNSRVITREYQHKGSFQIDDPMRQGPESSEHCDILGNYEVLEDLIQIATGKTVEARIVSNIEDIATEIREKK